MSKASFEVEVKFAIKNPKSIEAKLSQIGAVKTNTETQIDTYFNHPCRSFEYTDEALRLRSREQTVITSPTKDIPPAKVELTYKGPKLDVSTKTRFEMSAGFENLEAMQAILKRLGFREVATIEKQRVFFSFEGKTVSIDYVQNVGTFLEVETVVDSEDMIPESREAILTFVESIGLRREDSIRESYLELFLRKEYT